MHKCKTSEKGGAGISYFPALFYETKKNSNYHMTQETQDRDSICFRKDTPITVTSMIHNHDGYEIYLFLSGDIRMGFETTTGL